MLYPKIKIKNKKRKRRISNIMYHVKSFILDGIKALKSKKCLMSFLKRNFHF